ncbi:thiamine biosynthesis lipoprotein [Arcicella aurantiaca]|uniref:FAD:protein FMN transferase n=1 Tax=Arcicella aurantiaca TaxID=591202 RepID=A0A316E002_9BACT|nr:FAD:protein FMN transferase [Arcicella aurantiaca]PWK16130.1 thiamine biosynthesis lipoprotein [Arcicella aurantiaca]
MVQIFSRIQKLMGNRFELSVVSDNEIWANEKIDSAIAEISRIEQLLTTFKSDSQTNQINDNAGIMPVKVDKEVFELIQRSLRISALTQGAFDITYGSIDKSLWNFDAKMTVLPDREIALKMVELIDYQKVILSQEECTVFLQDKGMRIGFGGIGKGYAAEMAKRLMIQEGVKSGIVNASGDLTTWGLQPDGKQWTIGIADPNHKNRPFSYLNISNMAVATSGDYEKFVMIDGKRYSHTINPQTGLPVTGIKSVTIIAPNAEIADALATPVTVMGVKVGLDLINQIKGIACVIVDDHDKMFTSKNINIR